MKKTILTFLLFCFAVFSVSAQSENTNTTISHQKNAVEKSKTVKENVNTNGADQSIAQDENPNAPVIQFEKMEHDYGTITQESDGLCTFKFFNAGREPLMLYNVKSSWGCTVPAWPKQPVLPGDSAEIVVKYNTNKVGIINKSITVTSNAKQSTVTLKILGKVEAKPASSLPENTLDGNAAPVNK